MLYVFSNVGTCIHEYVNIYLFMYHLKKNTMPTLEVAGQTDGQRETEAQMSGDVSLIQVS